MSRILLACADGATTASDRGRGGPDLTPEILKTLLGVLIAVGVWWWTVFTGPLDRAASSRNSMNLASRKLSKWMIPVFAIFVIFAPVLIAQSQARNGSSAAPLSTGQKVIKGAPFSADTILITDTFLPNGEHVHNELHGRLCRDAQGRTYLDLGFRGSGGGQISPILITDPVAHTLISLDPGRKFATIDDWPSRLPRLPSNGAPPPPEPRQPRTVKEEDLGIQTMEGLTVKGTRTTKTYSSESETVGADNSFVITTWFSDELQIIVSTQLDGYRDSSKTSQVNIVRTEPSNSLFQIPLGYEVSDSRKSSN
jgi:hypothetical protein